MTENPFLILENRLKDVESILSKILDHVTQTTQVNADSDQVLTAQEAAAYLKLALPTIYSMVQRRVLPVYKQGKHLYFSKDELCQWVKQGRKKTRIEIEAEATAYTGVKRKRKTASV